MNYLKNKLLLLLVVSTILITSCAGDPAARATRLHGARGALTPDKYYYINQGDTLFGIAWRYGLDIQELASWNGIDNNDRILAGNRLLMQPPRGVARIPTPPAPKITSNARPGWIWPTRGKVTREFIKNRPGHNGILIEGKKGQAIFAARDGEVVYNDTGLSGYGRMIIIRHEKKTFSAYGYIANTNVKEKQYVRKGQQIGTMGISAQKKPALLFETRQNGRSVNPYGFIGSKQR